MSVPKKQLGQHFLIDDNILGVIGRLAELEPDDVVLEIGPGLGALPATVRPVPVLGAVASAARYFIVLNVGLGLGFVRFALGLQRPFWSTTPRSGGPILTRTATPGGGLGGGRRGPLR